MNIEKGAIVRCTSGNIDRNVGHGLTGVVIGFAQFSSHHPREALVKFGEKHHPHPADGWFWLSSLELV